jgi:hypothetical protein
MSKFLTNILHLWPYPADVIGSSYDLDKLHEKNVIRGQYKVSTKPEVQPMDVSKWLYVLATRRRVKPVNFYDPQATDQVQFIVNVHFF